MGSVRKIINPVITEFQLKLKPQSQKPWSGRKPFCSPGGNTGLSIIIASLLPPHHLYVEPFCGGAATFFRKKPSPKEALNDLNPDIAFAYQFIRDHTKAQREALKLNDWTLAHSTFKTLAQTSPEDPVERFYRFVYLTLGSCNYEGLEVNPDYVGERMEVVEYLPQWQKRLKEVEILNTNYSVVLERYDSPHTLFYIDPPYWQVGWRAPCPFYKEDWDKLIELIQMLKAKVLLSAAADIVALPSSWERRRIRIANRTIVEWLFANYPLPSRKYWRPLR